MAQELASQNPKNKREQTRATQNLASRIRRTNEGEEAAVSSHLVQTLHIRSTRTKDSEIEAIPLNLPHSVEPNERRNNDIDSNPRRLPYRSESNERGDIAIEDTPRKYSCEAPNPMNDKTAVSKPHLTNSGTAPTKTNEEAASQESPAPHSSRQDLGGLSLKQAID